ncbi:MAG: hypothetical protein LQ350_002070 [Teloschistes chrysophthalmus]|nr:MAG: hypothetical protein LQ350_002070 [Niorma chrysophthalma]
MSTQPPEHIWTLTGSDFVHASDPDTDIPYTWNIQLRTFQDRQVAIDAARRYIHESTTANNWVMNPVITEYGRNEFFEFFMMVIDDLRASVWVMVSREEVVEMRGGASDAEVLALLGLDGGDGAVDEEGSEGTLLGDDGEAGAMEEEDSEGTVSEGTMLDDGGEGWIQEVIEWFDSQDFGS